LAPKPHSNFKIAADNRKARFNYEIGDVFEAGIALTGTEVKSLRTGKATIGESYAHAKNGEIFLVNADIPEYLQANQFNHERRRPRKLLLRMREIVKLEEAVEREGMTIVPLKIFSTTKAVLKSRLPLVRAKNCMTSAKLKSCATGAVKNHG